MAEKAKSTNGLSTDMEWVKKILVRVEKRLDAEEDQCRKRHTALDKELTAVKIKAGIYAGLASAIPVTAGVVVVLLNG